MKIMQYSIKISKLKKNVYEFMNTILNQCSYKGIHESEISVYYCCGFSVDIHMGKIEKYSFIEDNKVHLTVYCNNKKGESSSTEILPKNCYMLIDSAYEIAKFSHEDQYFRLPDYIYTEKQDMDLDLYHPWMISINEAAEQAVECESIGFTLNDKIINSDGINISTNLYCRGYANSKGSIGIIQGSYHSMSCAFIAKDQNTMQRDYDYTISRHHNDLKNIKKLSECAVNRTINRLGSRKINTHKSTVLFSYRISNTIFLNFISAVSGHNLYKKNSFLFNTIGKQIFPSGFKIYENPHILRGLNSSFFDDEGVPTKNNIFVYDGILKKYILDSYSARRLGLQTTANSGGVRNLEISYPNTKKFNELINIMNNGILITELMGNSVNIVTGDYSQGAIGFYVKNGEIQYPIDEITVSGNLKNMFKSIVAIGNDININTSIRCGSILIENMMISGL